MVTKSKKVSTGTKKGRVKVGKLKVNQEPVKALTTNEEKKVRGGRSHNRNSLGTEMKVAENVMEEIRNK